MQFIFLAQQFLKLAATQVSVTLNAGGGVIVGHAAAHSSGVTEFLGVPYAQPPTGDLRFQSPQAYRHSGHLVADRQSSNCPQLLSPRSIGDAGIPDLTSPGIRIIDAIRPPSSTRQISEDCLKLNVWTKRGWSGEKSKAVMVWIHGGGFQGGSTDIFLYDGQYLAKTQDVVVVSINYRLNVFGYPGLPGSRQNVGLEDQRMALEWIRTNIASFGGDPTRITLFGQSAGGTAIDYYTYAWTGDPIAHAFISESGVAESFTNPTLANNSASWYILADRLGCGGNSTAPQSSIACMQERSVEDILADLGALRLQFNPSVDNELVFSNYSALRNEGKFIQAPVLMGNNDYEAGIIKVLQSLQNMTRPLTGWAVLNLLSFTCPVGRAARQKSSHVPTWRYRYYGDFPNQRLTIDPSSGAWHGSEIATVFGTTELSGVKDTKQQRHLGRYIMGAWAAFAKDPRNALFYERYKWPVYQQDAAALIRLSFNNETSASYEWPVTYDYACDLVLAPGGPNMEELMNVANLTEMGGGEGIVF